ncbi:MAG TPA: DUF4062 domain-containing protein [Thermoanaerobaculia bacterium]
MRVFVSSTRADLARHREAVAKALLQGGFHPIAMEDFMARPEEPVEACLREVAEADLFVGIYAWRYGFVPDGHTVSITEEELREARRRNKPCFCFVVDEGFDWPAEHREDGEGGRKLRELKAWIDANLMRTTFTTPDDLTTRVLTTLLQRKSAPALTPERRKLLKLLDKVRQAWIEGVLEPSTKTGKIEPGREACPEAVASAWEGVRPDSPATEIEGPLLDLFRESQRNLLILGEPGSGKTTALLRLLRGLASEAERDPDSPVPVYLDLSSWAERRGSLADWLAREINERYRFDPDTARQWVRDRQLLPLLDGLDEVERECRSDCVDAIHGFLTSHGENGVAVACRTQDYEDLPARLKLENAVVLRPLAPEQIDRYLAAAGPELETLRQAVAGDDGLQELAQSPLMLSLMDGAFRGAGSETLDPVLAGPHEARRRRVLESYVERMEKRPGSRRYAAERTRGALAWLARGMLAHNLAWFQVEELQPSWLSGPGQRWVYALLSRGIGGALLVLPVMALALAARLASAPAALTLLPLGFAAGMLVGSTDALWTRRAGSRTVQAGLWRWARRSLLLGAEVSLLGLLAWRALGDRGPTLPLWLALAVVFGLAFGSRAGGVASDTRVFEVLKAGWSWRGALAGAPGLAGAGLLVLTVHSRTAPSYDQATRSPAGILAILAVLGALLGGFLGGLEGRSLAVRKKPNLGLRRALGNTGRVMIRTTAILILAILVILGGKYVFDMVRSGDVPGLKLGALLWGLGLSLLVGLWAGLWFSGMDILQNLTLRALISLSGRFPARWPRFLTHACERGLLRRAGGSYVFANRLLRDHFASLTHLQG